MIYRFYSHSRETSYVPTSLYVSLCKNKSSAHIYQRLAKLLVKHNIVQSENITSINVDAQSYSYPVIYLNKIKIGKLYKVYAGSKKTNKVKKIDTPKFGWNTMTISHRGYSYDGSGWFINGDGI